jgi:ABC-2 type transport system ATP-binding protein
VSPALRVSGVGRYFGELEALHDVSLELEAGELVALVGPNGAGKTTLLSIIAGSLRPSAGSVEPGPERVGWAPQQPALYSRLSVAENLRLFARLEGTDDPGAAVQRMLAQTDLRDRADELVVRLSGGNRQRVNVALALLATPPVLVLDEPSASLDPAQRERLWEFIADLARAGTAIVFSTHNVYEAPRYADRAIVLDAGRLVFDGPPAALMRAGREPPDGDFERALVAFLAGQPNAGEGAPA